jgi:repressor LexA
MDHFSDKLAALRKKMRFTQAEMAEKMGLSASYIHQLEVGKRSPSDSVITLVKILESQLEVGKSNSDQSLSNLPQKTPFNRQIPVLGWAHAGRAESYDELPVDWQETVPTECRDAKAFAVRLEGDSMEPRFLEGDLLVLQPSEEVHSGCLAVLKLADDGIVFRRIDKRAGMFILYPLNSKYETESISAEMIVWIYPVWGMWRQVWK